MVMAQDWHLKEDMRRLVEQISDGITYAQLVQHPKAMRQAREHDNLLRLWQCEKSNLNNCSTTPHSYKVNIVICTADC